MLHIGAGQLDRAINLILRQIPGPAEKKQFLETFSLNNWGLEAIVTYLVAPCSIYVYEG